MTDRPDAPPDPVESAPDASPQSTPEGGLPPEEEPTTTGTLFVMILFLMALAGMWILMYLRLLEV